MRMTKRTVRALLPLLVMGTAMPVMAAVQLAPAAEQSARRPDWLLLGVASVAFVIGRTVIPRWYKRDSKGPR